MKSNLITRGRALFVALGTLALAGASGTSHATLSLYDAAIAADNGGGLPYTAVLTSSSSVDTTNAIAFDFGAVSGSSTAEFIISGDPVGGGRDGYLAVGSNSTWNLRYEQWDDTAQMGFTHLGVADYLFVPSVTTPTDTTHVAYRWDQPTSTMELYLNGDLAGSQTAAGFEMPTGAGFLGNNAGLTEGMLGTFERVTVYDSAVDPTVIKGHANAWLAVPEPSATLLIALAASALPFRRRR